MAKNKLSGVAGGPSSVPEYRPSKAQMQEERRYRARDALSTLTRADEIRKDKALMKDVRCVVKEQVKIIKK